MKRAILAAALAAAAWTAAAKTPVAPPTLSDKPYSGERQTADVPASSDWTVMQNTGGTAAGSYSVYLVLNAPDAFEWAAADGVEVEEELAIVPFRITKAANDWTTAPAMAGWKWGEAASSPAAAAKFGDVGLVFNGTTADGRTVSGASSITAAGSYTAVFTVAETANYAGLSASVDFTVALGDIAGGGASGGGVSLTAEGYDGVYDGRAHTVNVSVSGASGETFDITYSTEEDGAYAAAKPTYTPAGTYTVWYKIHSASYAEYKGSLTVHLAKAEVAAPTLASKPYTGARQTADVPDSPRYDTVANLGGTSAGDYDVFLQLADGANYVWAAADGVTIDEDVAIVTFTITQAANEWTETPAITGWEWGKTASTPVAATRFGDVSLVYNGTTAGGASVSGATSITAPGDYTAMFTVAETADYAGLSASVPFTVTPGRINIDPNDPSEPRLVVERYEGVYDGAAHSITVQIVGAGAETFTITYARDEAGPFAPENPAFTDACSETVWYRITSDNFTPLTSSAAVAITPRDIARAAIAPIDDIEYADAPAEPTPVVTDGEPSIITADDYTVSYADNDAPGTATLTLTGRHNYTGTKTATFTITAPPVTAAGLTADIAWAYYKATGTYFAHLAVVCTNGLAAGIDDLSFRFADRLGADGAVEACLWNTPGRAANPDAVTEGGETWRVVTLDAARIAAENEPVVYGVADTAAATIPVLERAIELYVHRRVVPQTGNEGAAQVGDFVGYMNWTSGGETFAVPVVAEGSALHAPLAALRAASAPQSRTALNASLAVGVPVDAASDPYCRLAAFAVEGDTLRGVVETGVRTADGAERKGTPGGNARVTLLGAASLADPFEEIATVTTAADGAFTLARPNGYAFFKLRLDIVDIVK